MKKLSIALAMLSMTFAACQKAELAAPENTSNESGKEVFTASVEEFDSQTKTSLQPGNFVVWSSGDKIAIFRGNTVADEYQLIESSAGTGKGAFERIVKDGVINGDFFAGTELSRNVAFYPYSDCLNMAGVMQKGDVSTYTITNFVLPSSQIYVRNSFANGAFPMFAVTENTEDYDLKFKNVLGAMKLQVKGTQVVKSIKVEGANGEILSGAATVTAYANNLAPTIKMVDSDDACRSVTLDCGDGVQLSESEATNFIIALPPVSFSTGFIVSITDINEQTYTLAANTANDVLRSSILVMPEMKLSDVSEDIPGFGGEYPITIDGDFSDWDELDPSKVSVAVCDPNARYTALRLAKVYVDDVFINVYFEFDATGFNLENVLFHVYINEGASSTMGNFIFKESFDWLLEGVVISDNEFCSYDPGLYCYDGSKDIYGWDFSEYLQMGSGIGSGAGARNSYEFAIMRDMLIGVNLDDTFTIGFEILNDWNTAGVLPNTAATDENYHGAAEMLKVNVAGADYIDEYGINYGPGVEIDGVVWAPVNCGYHKTDYKWGKMYQWGRDCGHGFSGVQYDINGNIVGEISDASTPELVEGTVSEGESNVFYYGSIDWLTTRNDKLWNSGSDSEPVKTQNDPCPKGWRVPTYAELSNLCKKHSAWTTDETDMPGYWFSGSSPYSETVPQIFLPAAGYRGYMLANTENRGLNGYYWSSKPYARKPDYMGGGLSFGSTSASMHYYGRAGGYSVRCVLE